MITAKQAKELSQYNPEGEALEKDAESKITKAAQQGDTTVTLFFFTQREKSHVSKFLLNNGYRVDSFQESYSGHQCCVSYSIKVLWD